MRRRIVPKCILIVMLICAICASIAVAYAEPSGVSKTPISEVKIMHISDVHYIPTYYCYQGKLKENDFATKIKGDPKLMLESYAVLEETMNIIATNKPDYLFVTGDITSNGEMQALIDIANALRQVQNKVRETNPKFQILVVPGNHDVFNNRHASNYNYEDGKKREARSASRLEFVKIFASLGYPDITDAEAEAFYSGDGRDAWLVNGHHLPYTPNGDIAYIPSTTREGLRFEYFMPNLEAVEVDGLGGLTYIAYDDANHMSIVGFDTTLSVRGDQRTEGEYQKSTLDWYLSKDLSAYTEVSLGHHNIINHYSLQEQYTQAFVTYGWEETAEALASHGVRYSFTGHFHASDIASYVSFNNNVMYDIETGATISEGSAVRNLVLKNYGGGVSDMTSNIQPVDKANLSYLINEGIMPEGYDDCFIDKSKGIIDVHKYIESKLFQPFLENIIDSFISVNKIDGMVKSLRPIELKVMNKAFTIDLKEIVTVLLDEVSKNALKDYNYSGDIESLKARDNKVIAYANELLSTAIKKDVAAGKALDELVLYCYGAHLKGGEVMSEAELPEWVQAGLRDFRDGKNMDIVLDEVLNSENGLYNLVEKIANTPINLARCTKSKATIESVLSLLKLDVDLQHVVLNTLVPEVLANGTVQTLLSNAGISLNLKGNTMMEIVDYALDTYLDTSIKSGIGSILADIATSMAVDVDIYDGNYGETVALKYDKNMQYSVMGNGKNVIEPTRENGRLPSELTVTFGADPKSAVNMVWTTSQFAPSGTLRYRELGSSDWTEVSADTRIMPYAFPLFDLGIYTTTTDKNIARHNVRLTGLKSGKTYEYMAGDASRDVWTQVGTFTTAPSDNGAFEMAIFSDMQGVEADGYTRVAKVLAESGALFEGGKPSFAVSLGDMVNSGKNDHQWRYALDIPADYWMNTVTVAVAGGTERKPFTSGKVKERKKPTMVDIETMTYQPLHFHYDMGDDVMGKTNYYSFDYSNVHFVVLDTRDTNKSSGVLGAAQLKWLKADLANAGDRPKVVLMHKGIYAPGMYGTDKSIVALRAQLSKVFYDNKVDIVFQGNDQVYAETAPLDASGVEAEDGVRYITLGSIGDKHYSYVDDSAVPTVFHEDAPVPTIGKLVYDGTTLTYQGYDEKGDKLVKVEDYAKNNMVWLYLILGVIAGGAIVFGIVFTVRKKGKNKAQQG